MANTPTVQDRLAAFLNDFTGGTLSKRASLSQLDQTVAELQTDEGPTGTTPNQLGKEQQAKAVEAGTTGADKTNDGGEIAAETQGTTTTTADSPASSTGEFPEKKLEASDMQKEASERDYLVDAILSDIEARSNRRAVQQNIGQYLSPAQALVVKHAADAEAFAQECYLQHLQGALLKEQHLDWVMQNASALCKQAGITEEQFVQVFGSAEGFLDKLAMDDPEALGLVTDPTVDAAPAEDPAAIEAQINEQAAQIPDEVADQLVQVIDESGLTDEDAVDILSELGDLMETEGPENVQAALAQAVGEIDGGGGGEAPVAAEPAPEEADAAEDASNAVVDGAEEDLSKDASSPRVSLRDLVKAYLPRK